jgi:hypothetical protein
MSACFEPACAQRGARVAWGYGATYEKFLPKAETLSMMSLAYRMDCRRYGEIDALTGCCSRFMGALHVVAPVVADAAQTTMPTEPHLARFRLSQILGSMCSSIVY